MLKPELQRLVGTPIMSAVNTLSAMGFRCSDVTRQALHSGQKSAGTFLCTPLRDVDPNRGQGNLLLTFSEQGVVLDVLQNNEDSSAA
jgi:hypothetical protein